MTKNSWPRILRSARIATDTLPSSPIPAGSVIWKSDLMRKLLLIAQSFSQHNMGAVRLRRIARHLPAFGYRAYRPDLGRGGRDAAFGVEYSCGLRATDLTRIYRKLARVDRPSDTPERKIQTRNISLTSALNRWFMIPDKHVSWLWPAIREARSYLRSNKVDAIFASLEPRTNLLVAARLAREFELPCVMEYRDLWTGSPYYHLAQPTILHRWIHALIEKRALRQATRVTCVSKGLAQYLSRRYGDILKAPVQVNYNFYDLLEYPPPAAAHVAPFVVSYTGAMYMSRGPSVFLRGLKMFLDRFGLRPIDFRFRWLGSVVGVPNLDRMIQASGTADHIDWLGQVSHSQALKEFQQSDVALILQSPDDAVHIPGKLFEAMGARVPVLLLSNPCEVADIVQRANAGVVCPHDPTAVSEALGMFWDRRGKQDSWPFNSAEIEQFSAGNAVGKLARLIDEAVESA